MVELIKLEIETLGFFQLVEGQTRSWIGQEDSMPDHLWTNKPENVLQIRNIVRSSSDHNVVEALIRIKGKAGISQEVLKIKRKNFDDMKFKQDVQNINWDENVPEEQH